MPKQSILSVSATYMCVCVCLRARAFAHMQLIAV